MGYKEQMTIPAYVIPQIVSDDFTTLKNKQKQHREAQDVLYVLNSKTEYWWNLKETKEGYVAQAELKKEGNDINKFNLYLSKQLGISSIKSAPTGQYLFQIGVDQIKKIHDDNKFPGLSSEIDRYIISKDTLKGLYQYINSMGENERKRLSNLNSEDKFDVAMQLLKKQMPMINAKKIAYNDTDGYIVNIKLDQYIKLTTFIKEEHNAALFALSKLREKANEGLNNNKNNKKASAVLTKLKEITANDQLSPFDRVQNAKKIIDEAFLKERKNYTSGMKSFFRNVRQFDENVNKGEGKYSYPKLLQDLSNIYCDPILYKAKYREKQQPTLTRNV